jgi:hypothetical protein
VLKNRMVDFTSPVSALIGTQVLVMAPCNHETHGDALPQYDVAQERRFLISFTAFGFRSTTHHADRLDRSCDAETKNLGVSSSRSGLKRSIVQCIRLTPGKFEWIGRGRSAWCTKAELSGRRFRHGIYENQ